MEPIFKCQHPLHPTWNNMRLRCNNPNATSYPWYGGMGITVCQRWNNDFWAFVEDMGPKPSSKHILGRHDMHGPYSPENCYWSTKSEQARKAKRGLKLKPNPVQGKHKAYLVRFNGEMQTLQKIAEYCGIKHCTLRERLNRGWTLEEATTTPVNPSQSEKIVKWNVERALREQEARKSRRT